MSDTTLRVVVVGAGIVGAACAHACASAGMNVTLVEATKTAGGATAVATGHVVATGASRALLVLATLSRRRWQEIGPRLPAAAGYWEPGTVWLSDGPRDRAALAEFGSALRAEGILSEWWDPDRLRDEEPALRGGLEGGLLVGGDAVVRPSVAVASVVDWASAAGANVVRNRAAVSVTPRSVKLSDGSTVRADRVVVAAGTATGRLLPAIPMRPRRGHLVSTAATPGLVRHQLLDASYLRSTRVGSGSSVVFNVHPRPNGELVLGSSRDYAPEGAPPDPATFERIVELAVERLPGLARVPIRDRWVGYRPASADDLPYIGPWPGPEGVWVATGHEGLGVTCSLGTGEMIAKSLAGRTPPIPIDPYLPTEERLRAARSVPG